MCALVYKYKGASDPLELDFQAVVIYPIGAGM